jgi:hypothetical protein
MVSSMATSRLGRIGGMTRISQCGCTEMISTVGQEARRRHQEEEGLRPFWSLLLNYPPVRNVKLLFVIS